MGKVKKEKNSRNSQEKKSNGEGNIKRNAEKKKSSNDEGTRKYGYISPASVILMAEAAGFSGIQEDVARNLAEDVTYRLRYIIQQCKKYMIHCKRKKLSSADINEVLKMCDIPAIYGYTADKPLVNFTYVKEAEVFVLNDEIIDLASYALSEILVQKKPSYYATGNLITYCTCGDFFHLTNNTELDIIDKTTVFILLIPENQISRIKGGVGFFNTWGCIQKAAKKCDRVRRNKKNFSYGRTCSKCIKNVKICICMKQYQLTNLTVAVEYLNSFRHRMGTWLKPDDKAKSENKSKDSKSSNSDVQSNSENVKMSSKSLLHNDNQRLESESEENETKIPTSLIKYYGIMCNTILVHSDLKMVFQDLSTNSRIGPIIPYLLNFITIALNKLSSERQLKRLLQAVEALSRNKSIDFGPYSATTRVINAMLLVVASDKKSGKMSYDFHLRSYAARVLSFALSQWCSRDEQKSTIVKKMGKLLLDFKASPKVHYGAIALLTALGPKTLDGSLWKILSQYLEHVERLRLSSQYKTGNDVAMLEEALLGAATSFYRCPESARNSTHFTVDDSLSSYFGDAICNVRLPTCSSSLESSAREDAQELNSGKKHAKPLKYMNSLYKPTVTKLSVDSVFTLPKPRKRKNTKIIFKFAGAIPVPEVSLKRRRFYSQYSQFIAGKESEGHVVVAGKGPKMARKDNRSPSFAARLFSVL